jgi:hypothetical protein
MSSPAHPPRLDHSTYTWQRTQVMKLLVTQFSPPICHFICLQSKYSPQHTVLKHPQSTFLPKCQRPSFVPIHHRQNYSPVYSNCYDFRQQMRRYLSSPCCPDWLWDPPSLCNGYQRLFPPGIKRPEREADQSLLTSAEVKKTWIFTFTPHTTSWHSP